MSNLKMILDLDNEILGTLERGINRALRFGDVETAKRKRREMHEIEEERETLARIWYRRHGK